MKYHLTYPSQEELEISKKGDLFHRISVGRDCMKYHLTYPSQEELENATKGLGAHSGNVIAIINKLDDGPQGLSVYAWAPISNEPNAKVKRAKISLIYLSDYCRPINEQEARNIHPRLFKELDARK